MRTTIKTFKYLTEDILQTKILYGNYLKFLLSRTLTALHNCTKIETLKKMQINLKGKYIIKNRHGIFIGEYNDDSLGIYSPLFEYELQHWFNYDSKRDTFLDIGTNRGKYTIIALKNKNYKKAICFEPLKKNLETLKKNLKLNKLENKTEIHPYGLFNRKTEQNIYYNKQSLGCATLIKNNNSEDKKTEKEKIKLIKLDEIIKNKKEIEKISFIKIDVECSETEILEGGKKFFKNLKNGTILMIEIWKQNQKNKRTIELLNEFGFKLKEKKGNNYLFIKKH